MKGWVDRVFANGTVYGGGGMRFDNGALKGCKAMLAIKTGCLSGMVEPDGLLGDIDVILWPLRHGTFRYSGMAHAPPFLAWSIHCTDDKARERYLQAYEDRLRNIESLEALPTHALADSVRTGG